VHYSNDVYVIFVNFKYCSIFFVNQVSVVGSKESIFVNVGTTLWRCFQTVYFLFKFKDEILGIFYVVGRDIKKDVLKVTLGMLGEVYFIFPWHA